MLFQSYDYIALCYLAMSVNRNKPIFLNTAFLLVDIWIDFYTTIWQKRLLLNLAIHEDFFLSVLVLSCTELPEKQKTKLQCFAIRLKLVVN